MRRRSLRTQKWAMKDGKPVPVLLEEMVLNEIVQRLWYEAKIKMMRINCPVGGKVRPNVEGIPDLAGGVPHCWTAWEDGKRFARTGVGLYIEVKRPGGARRPAQEQTINYLKSIGCIAFFAESWADVVRELAVFGLELKE